jgi:hypothetical protein
MQAESAEGNLLEEGRKKAREIALAYQPSDNFRLLLNNPNPASNRYVNRDEFLSMLDEVHIENASQPFSKVIGRVRTFDIEGANPQQELYLISDFQKSQADIALWQTDSNLQINLLPLISAARNNVFIDSCWFDRPVLQKGSLLKLYYRIKNLSDKDVEKLPVSLIVNNKQKALAGVDLKAGEVREEQMVFRVDSAGVFHARLELRDFPVTYDDRFYFGFSISERIKILSITSGDAGDALQILFSGDSLFDLTVQKYARVDYARLSGYDVLILDQLPDFSSGLLMELDKYLKNGGTLIIIPAKSAVGTAYEALSKALNIPLFARMDTARAQLTWMDVESPEYDDVFDLEGNAFKLPDNVDMPYFSAHALLQNGSSGLTLIKFDDGSPFLKKYLRGNTMVYLFTAAVSSDNSNITAHAIFVPVLYNLALQGNRQEQLYYTTGKEQAIRLQRKSHNPEDLYHIAAVDGTLDFIPGIMRSGAVVNLLVDASSIQNAGNYKVTLDGRELQSCAFNYPRAESDLQSLSPAQIEEEIARAQLENINILDARNTSLTATVKDLHKGVQLWKLFLSLALLFLIIELFLLRFMK